MNDARNTRNQYVETLLFLLEDWAETILGVVDCPSPEQTYALNRVWRRLGSALSTVDEESLQRLQSDLTDLARRGRPGYPPIEWFRARLEALLSAGLSARFIAVAVRCALDDLILPEYPQGFLGWRSSADAVLLKALQFAFGSDDVSRDRVRYEPDSGDLH